VSSPSTPIAARSAAAATPSPSPRPRAARTPRHQTQQDADDVHDAPSPTQPQPTFSHLDLSLPADQDQCDVYFDGGFHPHSNKAGCGVYVSPTIFLSQKLGGRVNSALAETQGALWALRLALDIVKCNPHIRRLRVLGDNFGTVMTLASREELFRGTKGRSLSPATWLQVHSVRQAFDAYLRSSDRPPLQMDFVWVPRRCNQYADHLATCAIINAQPTFRDCEVVEIPTKYGTPSLVDLQHIAEKALLGSFRSCWRSIHPLNRPAWHAIVAKISVWDHGAWALYLAPLVLLQRFGDTPIARFARLASTPNLLEQMYYHAANDDPPPSFGPSASFSADRHLDADILDRLAAHSPARALKRLVATPAATPDEARLSLLRRLGVVADATRDPIVVADDDLLRWAQDAYDAGKPVIVADIVDAYWVVRRASLASSLARQNSPLFYMCRFVYGTPPLCKHSTYSYFSNDGMLPGCGGAAILHGIDTQNILRPVATSKTTAVYVDDVTCISIDTFTRIKAALAASDKQLAKIVVLCRGGLAALPAELRAYWEPAMRLLGGHVGDHEAASTMFAAHIHEKLQLIRTVQSAPMSLQSKFACLRSLDSGLRWKVMATSPAITAPTVAVIDDAVSSAVFSSCIDGSIPTHKSKALITIPTALGGLGWTNYAQDSERIFDLTTAHCCWPQHTMQVEEDNIPPQGVTSKMISSLLRESAIERATSALGTCEAHARLDESVPWFNIARIMRHLRISDDAFALSLANYLRCDVRYPVCSFAKGKRCNLFDHSQRCHRCGGPYRHQRHQVLVTAVRTSFSRYAVQSSENLAMALGLKPKSSRPDIIVYRNSLDEKPLVLDVSLPHQSERLCYDAVNKQYNAKAMKYKTWHESCVDFAPFIISTFATVHPKTLATLQNISKIASGKSFMLDAVARAKVSIIQYELHRYRALLVREASGALDVDIASPSDSDDESSADSSTEDADGVVDIVEP
jgi:ribonuclease HI